MLKIPDCEKCNNSRIIKSDDGTSYVKCECVIKFKISNIASEFLPAVSPTKQTREAAEQAFSNTLTYVRLKDGAQLNPFMVLLTGEAVFANKSLAALKSYLLLDIYMNNSGALDQETRGIYGFAQDIIVLIHGHAQVRNKIALSLLGQTIDYYKKDRQVVFVMNAVSSRDAIEESKRLAVWHNMKIING